MHSSFFDTTADARADWALRRRRLERLAVLLEGAIGPVQLFSTMECYPTKVRLALRAAGSPLALAYDDAFFRGEGLRGDAVRDGVEFFRLSMREAHKLLCDCGYAWRMDSSSATMNKEIAARARKLAARRSIGEWVDRCHTWMSGWSGASASNVSTR